MKLTLCVCVSQHVENQFLLEGRMKELRRLCNWQLDDASSIFEGILVQLFIRNISRLTESKPNAEMLRVFTTYYYYYSAMTPQEILQILVRCHCLARKDFTQSKEIKRG